LNRFSVSSDRPFSFSQENGTANVSYVLREAGFPMGVVVAATLVVVVLALVLTLLVARLHGGKIPRF
jgi:hypothetical protein